MKLSDKQVARLKKRLYLTRSCGECKSCCTLLNIAEIGKPAGSPCPHMNTEKGKGCTVYETRPESCREWACIWRSGSNVTLPEERPDRAKVMLDTLREVPGKTWTDAIVCYETEPGGHEAAGAMIARIAQTRAVVLIKYDQTQDRRVIGPPHKVEEFLRVA